RGRGGEHEGHRRHLPCRRTSAARGMTGRVRPVSPENLVEELADRIAGHPAGAWVRVAVDGAPPAGPDSLADSLVDRLRERGRAAVRVRASDYLRASSLRYEHGRTDPHAFYEDWLDV